MLGKIMEMVGGDALNEMVGKAGISLDQAKAMLPLATDSLEEGISNEVKGGNLDGLLGMLNSAGGSGLMNNGIFSSIKGLFMKKIMTKMGLPESIAGLAAGSGLSSLVGGLAGKLREDGDNDDINADNLMNVLGGGGGLLGGLLGKAGGLLGGAKGLAGGILGGAADGAGGLMDKVKDVAGDLLGGDDKKDDDDKGGGLLGGLKDAAGGLFK